MYSNGNTQPISADPLTSFGELGFNDDTLKEERLMFAMDRSLTVILSEAGRKPAKFAQIDIADDFTVTTADSNRVDLIYKHPSNGITVCYATDSSDNSVLMQVIYTPNKRAVGTFEFDDDVKYIAWLDKETLVVITNTKVYHWNLEDADNEDAPESEPTLQFQFDTDFKLQTIRSYSVDSFVEPKFSLLCIGNKTRGSHDDKLLYYSYDDCTCSTSEGEASCFGRMPSTDEDLTYIGIIKKTASGRTLVLADPYGLGSDGEKLFVHKASVPFDLIPEDDKVEALVPSDYHGILFAVTEQLRVVTFSAYGGTVLGITQISNARFLTCTSELARGGLLIVGTNGIFYRVSINLKGLAQSFKSALGATESKKVLQDCGFPEEDEYNRQRIQRYLANGDVDSVARVALLSKSASARSSTLLGELRGLGMLPDGSRAILTYFDAVIQSPLKFTRDEFLEVARPAINNGRTSLILDWLAQNKIECTEELGKMLEPTAVDAALIIYARANAHDRVISILSASNKSDQLLDYLKTKKLISKLEELIKEKIVSDPPAATALAKSLLCANPPLVPPDTLINLFMGHRRLKEITSAVAGAVSLGALADQGEIATRILEQNIQFDVKSADYLLTNGVFKNYNKQKIAKACERAGLAQRALENYTDQQDLIRVFRRSGSHLPVDALRKFLSNLDAPAALEIVADLTTSNPELAVNAATLCGENPTKFDPPVVLQALETLDNPNVLYSYLDRVIPLTSSPIVHERFIKLSAQLGRWEECRTALATSSSYDAQNMLQFLNQCLDVDPAAYVALCDRHELIDELVDFLWTRDHFDLLLNHVPSINPNHIREVLLKLIDLGADDSFIMKVLSAAGDGCNVVSIISAMEFCDKLIILEDWLESKFRNGVEDVELHNALAKVRILRNNNPEEFLRNGFRYNAKEIGLFAETKNAELALIAYEKGNCARDFIRLTISNGMLRDLCDFVLRSPSVTVFEELFCSDLEIESITGFLNQFLCTSISRLPSADVVYTAIDVLSRSEHKHLLLMFLEKILTSSELPEPIRSDIVDRRDLNDKLIMAIIETEPTKLNDILREIKNYTPNACASFAVSIKAFDSAVVIYNHSRKYADAMQVLIGDMHDIESAENYAGEHSDPGLWSLLGNHAVKTAAEHPEKKAEMFRLAIRSYNNTNVIDNVQPLIELGKELNELSELCAFLTFSTDKIRGIYQYETDLAYCIAMTQDLRTLDAYVSENRRVNSKKLAEVFYSSAQDSRTTEEAAQAARIAKFFYESSGQHAKVANCSLLLGDLSTALESAERAGNNATYLHIVKLALEQKNLSLAHKAAFHLLTVNDDLESVIALYRDGNFIDELISLLESGSHNNKAITRLITELAILYAQHRQDKLSHFIASHASGNDCRVNFKKIINECVAQGLWKACVELHSNIREFDAGFELILQHQDEIWDFRDITNLSRKVTNKELLYNAINVFIQDHPHELVPFLNHMSGLLTYDRVIDTISKHPRSQKATNAFLGPLGICISFWEKEQAKANTATQSLNELLNNLYVISLNPVALEKSITTFKNFNAKRLAESLANHENSAMKSIALTLFNQTRNYSHAIELAKKFGQYSEATGIAASSEDPVLAEKLLGWFAERPDTREHFIACVQACEDFIPPATVIRLSWIYGYHEDVMPYIVRQVESMTSSIASIEARLSDSRKSSYEVTPIDGISGGTRMLM